MIEIKRKVSSCILTEQGLYHVGQIPTSYQGAYLTIEVTHVILFADDNGNLQVYTCNPPKVKNSDGSFAPFPANGVTTVEAETNENDIAGQHRLPLVLKNEVNARIAIIEAQKDVDGNPVHKVI
jgi:hypothetical protein